MNPLVDELAREGLRIADLETIYQRRGPHRGFRRYLLGAIDLLDPEIVWHALWLLRRSLRDQPSLAIDDQQRLLGYAKGFDHWVARLTFCQLMAAVDIPESLQDEAFPLLLRFANDRRPIIRAWSVSALYPHRTASSFAPQITALITLAEKEKSSKAMQARLRRLKSQPGKNVRPI